MFRIGIDVGSTYTKYCVLDDSQIIESKTERTPLHQKEFFQSYILELRTKFPDASIVSCGYGKGNVETIRSINELIALAKGSYYIAVNSGLVLDIGGQDTKIIRQEKGKLVEFFINDKCAAGSGMFLTTILDRIGIGFTDIDLLSP